MPVSPDGEHSLASAPVMPVRDDGAGHRGPIWRAAPEHDDPNEK